MTEVRKVASERKTDQRGDGRGSKRQTRLFLGQEETHEDDS